MNILFLEDEVELSAIGVEQLRNLGHSVFPALDLSEARSIVDENWQALHLIIADHRLPDGRGIDYLLEVKQIYPRIKLAVVSGCLSPDDERILRSAEIPFFTKPLLYRQVMQKLREHYMIKTQPPFKKQTSPQMQMPPPSPPRPPSANGQNAAPPSPPAAPPTPPPQRQAPNPVQDSTPPPAAKPVPVQGMGLLAAAGIDISAPVKRKGLTSVIFGKLTRKD